jgi:hypothetical protein
MEYQYYEFRAVDRPLTEREMRDLRSISSRAEITPVSFTNHYEWGNFKGDPRKMMFQYFDAFLYLANWGTRQVMFRVPADAIDAKAAAPYSSEYGTSVEVKGEYAVVDLYYGADGEGGDWDDDENDEGSLASLLPLRESLIEGDLRPLYLGWLASVQDGAVDEDAPEPPVPPGLKKLTAPLLGLARFLRINADLLDVAVERSADAGADAGPVREQLADRIASLPETERNVLLLDIASGEVARARRALLKRLRDQAPRPEESARATTTGRTAGELLAAAEARAQERQQRDAVKRAKQRAKREAEAVAAREKYLDQLTGRQEETWTRVETLIGTKQPKSYDEAVILLADLRDVGMRDKRLRSFESRVRALCDRHAKKPSLIERLRKAKMLTWGGVA